MGAYFSLHDAAFWDKTITEAPDPSIWSNVHFSPLSGHQRVLLERPGRVHYSSNSGLRQGGVCVQVSEVSEVSLLVGFEEQAGRLYSAVLLRAPDSQLHRYGRELEELTLTAPGKQADLQTDTSLASPSSMSKRLPELSSDEFGEYMKTLSTTSGKQSMGGMVDDQGETRELSAGHDVVSLGIELIATDQQADQERMFVVTSVDKGGWAEKQHIQPGDEIVEIKCGDQWMHAHDMSDQDFKVAWNQRPLEFKVFEKGKARHETEFPYLLIYTVKEGVLLFFSSDIAECEEIVREVALSFGNKRRPPPQDIGSRTSPKGLDQTRSASPKLARFRPKPDPCAPGPGTEAAENLQAALRVKCVEHWVGRVPPQTTRTLTELIVADLKRTFAVACDAEDQPNFTNCAVFCMRFLMILQLSFRGYDIRTICEDRSDLGNKAGETVCGAYEELWRKVRP